mmetsp:Transcript_614/g.550  ORF Transcript_614/g.550 Transcript_614/m.550 type:complete len:348 (+) Transcript_614:1078-2121(+)
MEDRYYERKIKAIQERVRREILPTLDKVLDGKGVTDDTEFEWDPARLERIRFVPTKQPIYFLQEVAENKIAAAMGFPDFYILILDLKTLKIEKTLRGHIKSVTNLMMMRHEEKDILVSTGCDMFIKGWDMAKEPEDGFVDSEWSIKGHNEYIFGLTKINDELYATSSHDKTVKVWKMGKNAERYVLSGHSGPVWSVIRLQDQMKLASASAEGRIFIWDYEAEEATLRIKAHSNQINCIIPYKKTQIMSCGDDGLVKISDWETGETLKEVVLNAHSELWGIHLAHDDDTLFCWGIKNDVLIFSIGERKLLPSLTGFDESVKAFLRTSNNYIVTGSYDYRIRTFNSITL